MLGLIVLLGGLQWEVFDNNCGGSVDCAAIHFSLRSGATNWPFGMSPNSLYSKENNSYESDALRCASRRSEVAVRHHDGSAVPFASRARGSCSSASLASVRKMDSFLGARSAGLRSC